MLIPLRTDAPMRRTPWVNRFLVVGTVLAYMVQLSLYGENLPPMALDPADPRVADFLGYIFLHGSWGHLLSNLVFLWIFGNNVNDRLGQVGYLAFYLASGVVAGLAHAATSVSPVVGASGAVAGVCGAYMVLLPRSRVTVLYLFILIGLLEIPSLWFVAFFFAMDLFWQLLGAWGPGETRVAHMAHIGGTLFGVAVCLGLQATRLVPRDMFDLWALIERWNRRREFRTAVREGYDPFARIPAQLRREPDPEFDRVQDLRAQIAEAIAHDRMSEAAGLYDLLVGIDGRQVLSKQSQLDLANFLYNHGDHARAAAAYERLLEAYPRHDQHAQVRLMLGLLYARYLNDPERARLHLSAATDKLQHSDQLELARDELARLQAGT
jgi:membrane associated rhomboid family serine protease